MNTTIEFCILQLVYVSNFYLLWTKSFEFLDQIYPKKDISGGKEKEWRTPLNFACSN